MKERSILMIGAGSTHDIRVQTPLVDVPPKITTLDIEPRHLPDVVWDLNVLPWPFEDNSYDEIHAYEILEHLGMQGDTKSFFAHFGEAYRILKPEGHLAGSCPRADMLWAWGDPGHRRVINEGSLTFLDQTKYATQVGTTMMSDYRSQWSGDFEAIGLELNEAQFYFLLRAHKPARA